MPDTHIQTGHSAKIGTCTFRSREVAEQVASNRAAFAAIVNREGMTDAQKEAAFSAFFQIKSPEKAR